MVRCIWQSLYRTEPCSQIPDYLLNVSQFGGKLSLHQFLEKKNLQLKLGYLGAGEMTQQLRTLTVLPEILSSIPSSHLVAHNHL